MLFLWPPNYVSATFTINAVWTDLFWYACVCCLLAQNDSHFSAMSLAINWMLKIHIQHRWTRHTICSLRITKTGKENKRDVKICTRDFTFVANEQRWLTSFYKSHGNHCNTSCLQSTLTPQKSVRIFFCNASSNSSATILVQAWISLGSARMRNTDSHIFQSNSILLSLVSVCGLITTRKILRRVTNIRPRRVLATFSSFSIADFVIQSTACGVEK